MSFWTTRKKKSNNIKKTLNENTVKLPYTFKHKINKVFIFFKAFIWLILSVSVFKSQIIILSVHKIALKGSCFQEGHWSSWSERVTVANPSRSL